MWAHLGDTPTCCKPRHVWRDFRTIDHAAAERPLQGVTASARRCFAHPPQHGRRCSAAFSYQCRACSNDWGLPSPLAYIQPRLHCASACPCAATFSNTCRAFSNDWGRRWVAIHNRPMSRPTCPYQCMVNYLGPIHLNMPFCFYGISPISANVLKISGPWSPLAARYSRCHRGCTSFCVVYSGRPPWYALPCISMVCGKRLTGCGGWRSGPHEGYGSGDQRIQEYRIPCPISRFVTIL